MGYTGWDPGSYDSYSTTVATKSRADIFTKSGLDEYLDPLKFKIRESRDSTANPESTPIIIASDVTGSMGGLAEQIIKRDLGIIMGEIYNRVPVSNPHILVAAVGDSQAGDRAPFQATQFESDISIASQMEKFFIEGGGGGNRGEQYILAWYFAAFRTECDAILKRGKKGYLFTIGDEAPLLTLTKNEVKKYFGDDIQDDIKAEDLLDIVKQNWHVFHIIVKPHGRFTHDPKYWEDLLGDGVIILQDNSALGEVIVSTLQVVNGADKDAVAASWSGSTALVVADALKSITTTGADSDEVVAL